MCRRTQNLAGQLGVRVIFKRPFLILKRMPKMASCQALLGTLYKYGNGVTQDNDLSLKRLNESAVQENPTGLEQFFIMQFHCDTVILCVTAIGYHLQLTFNP